MALDWANASGIEITWTAAAAVAFLATLVLMRWVWKSFTAIRSGVRRNPGEYRAWGPRWNFTVLLIATMVCFGAGWLGFISIGLIAMATPPPIRETNQEASDWVAWLLIAMEAVHAAALGLLWVALRSLRAASKPQITQTPTRDQGG